MSGNRSHMLKDFGLWGAVAIAVVVPLVLAASSPLLEWRDPVYRIAGYAGVLGLALMLVQPLLASGALPGFRLGPSRKIHRLVGLLLVVCVVTHVVMLWITSPPDVVDALTFVSPTPFSVWGVIAMWAVFGAAALAVLRQRISLRVWRLAHSSLVLVTISGTVVHALLIEGTMETVSKVVLCALVLLAGYKTIYDLRAWAFWTKRRQS